MDKKVLITGVAGFIGSNLADRLLAEGYSVAGIDNLNYGLKEQIPSGVEFFECDIRSNDIYPLLKNIDTVFHLAAKNCISDCEKDPVETTDINVRGTINVFEAARQAGVRKVVYAESSAVYEGSNVLPTPETEEHPQSMYANSKLASHFFAQSYIKKAMDITSLRYFNVYGPKQDYRRSERPIMSEFILQLLTGQTPVMYGQGSRTKDYIYVDDINDFHILVMADQRTKGQTYNLGSGQETTFRQVLNIIQKLLGTNVTPEEKPALTGGVMRTLADIGKAKSLGWQPKTNLEEGIKKQIDYMKREVLPKL